MPETEIKSSVQPRIYYFLSLTQMSRVDIVQIAMLRIGGDWKLYTGVVEASNVEDHSMI